MADVLHEVLQKCRSALLGGTPILYIKTDSDIFIRQLVSCEDEPLVVLLSSGGGQAPGEEQELRRMRPIYELRDPRDKQLKYCKNYREGVPRVSSGLYPELYASEKDKAARRGMGPVLWSCKMPDGQGEEARKIHESLERYVADHEDPGHPQYLYLQSSVVLLYSSTVSLSPMLRGYTEVIDVGYPDEEEIRELIKSQSAGDPSVVENERYLDALCTDFKGFSAEEVTVTMQRIMAVTPLKDSKRVEQLILKRKRQRLEGGLLEQCAAEGDIGGMESFRAWLERQRDPLKNANSYKRSIGTLPPKGVLLCGIPGCGKSAAARFAAHTLELPLLKMDIGSLMDKYQGVSEQRMREALQMAKAMSPCVLWIDELEKGFSGASSGDDPSFKRMFGYLLGWMQDNEEPCFIFATANDIGGLPKEFFRSGRFDALYAVYAPTAEECVGIFQVWMERAEKTVAKERHLERKEVCIFGQGCREAKLLRRVVNEALVRQDGTPRIVIGSDIQKIFSSALRTLGSKAVGGKAIGAQEWENALRDVIASPGFTAYGDGKENVDSIAISYCRMLRKGFIPTSDTVLFRTQDYHMEYAQRYERLKSVRTEAMGEEERRQHEQELRRWEVLQDRHTAFPDAYDRAVYAFLRARINEVAAPLEQRELEKMILR